MAKTISLNEFVYSELASLSGKLTAMAGKPISLGMTVGITIAIFEYARDLTGGENFDKKLGEALKLTRSSEEFDRYWEEVFKEITQSTS